LCQDPAVINRYMSTEYDIRLLKHSDLSVERSYAAIRLGQPGNRKAVEPLIDALGDVDSEVRGRAAAALGRIGDQAAIDPLIAALRDPAPFVRLKAVIALGELRAKRAMEPLLARLKDENEESEVRARVIESL